MLRRTDAYTIGVAVAALDLVLQVGIWRCFGLMLLLSVDALKNSIDLGTVPTWNSLAFALPIAMIGYTGLEKVGEPRRRRQEPREEPSRQRPHVGVHRRHRLQRSCDRRRLGLPDPPATTAQPAARRSSARSGWTRRCSASRTRSARRARSWVETRASDRGRVHRVHDPPDGHRDQLLGLRAGWPRRWAGTRSSRRSSARTSRRVLAPPAAIVSVSALLAVGFLVVGVVLPRRGDADAGVALLLRHPDRVHADPGGDHLAADLRAGPAEAVHDEGQRLDRPAADPDDLGGRRRSCRSSRGWSRSGTHPGARVVGPLWMIGGLALYAGYADPGRPSADRARRARGAAARGRDRHRLLHGRRAAGAARRDRRGDDGDGLPPGGRGRRGRGRRERDLRARPRPARQGAAGARGGGGGRPGDGGVAGRRSTASSTARWSPARAARAGSSSTPRSSTTRA